jgi:protein gp37
MPRTDYPHVLPARGSTTRSITDQVPDEYIIAIARVMATANWHTYQVLTKRSDRLRRLLNSELSFAAQLPHIWWGVSVEDKKYGVPRIAELQKAVAAVRFLSVEPLLEDWGKLDLQGIDWMIVGGESGPGARTMQKEWVLPLRDQCRKSKVSFFFKQWGGVRKAKTGRHLDGKTYDQFPKRISHPILPKESCASLVSELEGLFSSRDVIPAAALTRSHNRLVPHVA